MTFSIGNHKIGLGEAPFIILEAGINHNGDLDTAKEMVKVAKSSGADAIKFQTFKAEQFVANKEQMFTYKSQGKQVTESMLAMFQRYEFSADQWLELKAACDEQDIIFMSTPQNVSDLELLLKIGIPAIKVGSDDFTNLPLLKEYSKANLPMIISCGMANLGEVYDSVNATHVNEGKPVLIMLCTSQYPTPPKDVNMRKLQTLQNAFPNLLVGFSDHTQGATAAILSTGFGAVAYEKHFTLDHNLPGPDHWFSENPQTARIWVEEIRKAHIMLGSARLEPTAEEATMRTLARRSVTALQNINSGEAFSPENTGLLRPGDGLPPKTIESFLGQVSRKNILKGAQLQFSDID